MLLNIKQVSAENKVCMLSTSVPRMAKRLKAKWTLAQNNDDTCSSVYKAVSVSFILSWKKEKRKLPELPSICVHIQSRQQKWLKYNFMPVHSLHLEQIVFKIMVLWLSGLDFIPIILVPHLISAMLYTVVHLPLMHSYNAFGSLLCRIQF